MQTCPKCAEQIQDDAKVCRFCNAKLESRPSSKQNFLVVGGVIVGALILSSVISDDSPDAEKTAARARLAVTSAELVAAYEANEAAAQARYGSSILTVTGPIQSIDLDLGNEPVLRLSSEKYGDYVMANLSKDAQPKAAELQKGQTVTLECQGVGEVIGTPVLKDCTF